MRVATATISSGMLYKLLAIEGSLEAWYITLATTFQHRFKLIFHSEIILFWCLTQMN